MSNSHEDARAARLKAALRDNLRRRKSQARERAAVAGDGARASTATGDTPPVPDPDAAEPSPDGR